MLQSCSRKICSFQYHNTRFSILCVENNNGEDALISFLPTKLQWTATRSCNKCTPMCIHFPWKKKLTTRQLLTLVMRREMKRIIRTFCLLQWGGGGFFSGTMGSSLGSLPICLSWILPSHPQCTCNCPQYCEERKNGILVMKPICPLWEEIFLTHSKST